MIEAKRVPKLTAFEVVRFHQRIRTVHGTCWDWTGATGNGGYGRIYLRRQWFFAHRVSFALHKKERLNPRLVIDHVCMNTACVNPDHLRQVTHRTNSVENNNGAAAANLEKKFCIRNHPLWGANLRVSIDKKGHRIRRCVACRREWARQKLAKLRAAQGGSSGQRAQREVWGQK